MNGRDDAKIKTSTRYPYTIAWDFVRSKVTKWQDIGGVSIKVPSLGRSQVSSVAGAFAEALGMDREEFAKRIADYALSHQEEG